MTVVETGYKPAYGSAYPALWTRDHGYVVFHDPDLLTMAQLNQFVTHRLAKRSTSADGYANFIADRIDAYGVVTYKNPGTSERPFMDGIYFLVMVMYTVFKKYNDTSVFTANKTVIDACLDAIPRSANGCIYSDVALPSVDYGFTDTVKKTGSTAYGTALMAWSYKMLAEINGESGTGFYTTKFNTTIAGLASLRKSNGYYRASSNNNYGNEDVWATALIVAENLMNSDADRAESAKTLATAYINGEISQSGCFRHLPKGQYWFNTTTGHDSYQNGGFWLTPLWDIYRAVLLVSPFIAWRLRDNAIREVKREVDAEPVVGAFSAPYEYIAWLTPSGPRGYTASAAVVKRFV
jgi:hypothetical protein